MIAEGRDASKIGALPIILAAALFHLEGAWAFADEAFLGDGGDKHAVAGEDGATAEAAGALGRGAFLGRGSASVGALRCAR